MSNLMKLTRRSAIAVSAAALLVLGTASGSRAEYPVQVAGRQPGPAVPTTSYRG